jgi:NAD(P)-dependent dehydrogenase (short-subunit alcohol dehydrogenase family)
MPETVVITGASAGVGRATAHAFAVQGAQIGLIARGTQGLQAAAAEVEKGGGKALTLPLDVADPDAVEAAAESVENRFGPIDIWVNCAMAHDLRPVSSHFARRVSSRDRGDVSRFCLWHDGRLETNAAAQPRHYRPGRLCPQLPGYTAAIGLLRRQIRDPRVHRQRADGIAA